MTSPVDTSVKYLHSAMPGAPVLSGTAGALIAVLDACLVNGFGLRTVDSLVINNNVATCNIAAGHSAEVGTVVVIAGATPAALNGEQKVTAVSGNSVSFETAGLSNQTATGSITLINASLGWAKPFSGTNLAAYRSNDVTSNRNYLRIDDTNTNSARVKGYELMTDVNTGSGDFPTQSQRPSGGYWTKSASSDTNPRNYIICGDSKGFYLFVLSEYYTNSYFSYYFGEINSVKSNDAFSTYISLGVNDESSGSQQVGGFQNNTLSNNTYQYIVRSNTGLGSAVQVNSAAPTIFGNLADYQSGNSGDNSLAPFPNPSDGGLYLSIKNISEFSTRTYRGTLPGAYIVPQSVAIGQFSARDSIVGVAGLPGKTLRATTHYGSNNGSSLTFIDSTGPWR